MVRTQTFRNRRTRLWSLSAALIVIAATTAPARADVIFTNFGPGDTYNSNSGWTVAGPATPLSLQYVADHFNTGASAYDNLVFEGAFEWVANEGTNGLILELRQDDGSGLPGTVLETSPVFDVVQLPSSEIVTWTLPTSLTLNANTDYWFSARPNASDGALAWMMNNTGDNGFARTHDGSTWGPGAGASPAFRVSGSVAVIPEPGAVATALVFGGALSGLMLRSRHRRRSAEAPPGSGASLSSAG
jgi:hypothetical protein